MAGTSNYVIGYNQLIKGLSCAVHSAAQCNTAGPFAAPHSAAPRRASPATMHAQCVTALWRRAGTSWEEIQSIIAASVYTVGSHHGPKSRKIFKVFILTCTDWGGHVYLPAFSFFSENKATSSRSHGSSWIQIFDFSTDLELLRWDLLK